MRGDLADLQLRQRETRADPGLFVWNVFGDRRADPGSPWSLFAGCAKAGRRGSGPSRPVSPKMPWGRAKVLRFHSCSLPLMLVS